MSAHLTHQNLWSKKVLVPLWTIQLLLLLFAIGATIFVLASGSSGTGFAILGFNIACVAFTINEIIHYSRQRLQPLVYLIMQIIKVTFFLVMFIISLVVIVKDLQEAPYLVTVPAINLLAFLASLIYGSVIYHRYRKASTDECDLPIYAKAGSVDSGHAGPMGA